jgi:hypothetical protein
MAAGRVPSSVALPVMALKCYECNDASKYTFFHVNKGFIDYCSNMASKIVKKEICSKKDGAENMFQRHLL